MAIFTPLTSKRLALIAAGGCAAAALAAGMLLLAAWHVPAFYVRALAAEEGPLRQGSDELLARASAVANAMKREGKWYAEFAEQQINGWLSVDLAENHPDLLPAGFHDPRVHIEPGRMTIACAYDYPGVSTVLSVAIDLYLAEPRVVALRVHGARAGALPVPMTPIVDAVAELAERFNMPVQWRQLDGDPVALLTLPEARTGATWFRLESFELREKSLYLAGRTEAAAEPAPTGPTPEEPHADVAARPEENRNVQ